MPYVTFSRNLAGQRKLEQTLEESLPRAKDGNIVVLRGAKTIKKVIKDADLKGFRKVLIISRRGKSAVALEIAIKRKNGSLAWKFGKEKAVKA